MLKLQPSPLQSTDFFVTVVISLSVHLYKIARKKAGLN